MSFGVPQQVVREPPKGLPTQAAHSRCSLQKEQTALQVAHPVRSSQDILVASSTGTGRWAEWPKVAPEARGLTSESLV